MATRFLSDLIDRYVGGLATAEDLATLTRLLRYMPEARLVAVERGRKSGDRSLLNRASEATRT